MNIIDKIDEYLAESKDGDKAFKVLLANLDFYNKMKGEKDKETKEVEKLLDDLVAYYDEHESFSPGQAKAIYNISMGIKKMTGK